MLFINVSQFTSGCSSLSDNIRCKMQSHQFSLGHLSNLYMLLKCFASDVSEMGCLIEEDSNDHTHFLQQVHSVVDIDRQNNLH